MNREFLSNNVCAKFVNIGENVGPLSWSHTHVQTQKKIFFDMPNQEDIDHFACSSNRPTVKEQ